MKKKSIEKKDSVNKLQMRMIYRGFILKCMIFIIKMKYVFGKYSKLHLYAKKM